MSKQTQRDLKRVVFEAVKAQLHSDGFEQLGRHERFFRKHGEVTHYFQLVCLDLKPGWRIEPNVAVRFEQVEAIFHRTSGFPVPDQSYTPTIGASVGDLRVGVSKDSAQVITTFDEAPRAADEIICVFRESALSYFARYSNLQAVDAVLNDLPMERTPHRRDPWLRCSSGIIVARLVGRRNYEELKRIYLDKLECIDKGFYLPRYRSLLEILETVEPACRL